MLVSMDMPVDRTFQQVAGARQGRWLAANAWTSWAWLSIDRVGADIDRGQRDAAGRIVHQRLNDRAAERQGEGAGCMCEVIQ